MRFVDMRQVQAPMTDVWAALHDCEVLRRVIPGCERLHPLGNGEYAATLAARVGRLADTYRGTFAIDDRRPGTDLLVTVTGPGRARAAHLAHPCHCVSGTDRFVPSTGCDSSSSVTDRRRATSPVRSTPRSPGRP